MKLPGFWSDVVVMPGQRFALITGGAYDILCYDQEGVLLWTQPTPEGMWYMRAAALSDGTIAMLGQGQRVSWMAASSWLKFALTSGWTRSGGSICNSMHNRDSAEGRGTR